MRVKKKAFFWQLYVDADYWNKIAESICWIEMQNWRPKNSNELQRQLRCNSGSMLAECNILKKV